jgi:glycosyltransferase involved in cell wall biosynthesis
MSFEKLSGAISIASNIYGAPTGYGNQMTLLVDRLKRHKLDVAILANYGLEGRFDKVQSKYGKVPVYPRGFAAHSQDVIPLWFDHFGAQHPNKKHVLMTLYDVWIYNSLKFEYPTYSWVPLDHITLPADVAKFLMRPNVTPITMSPHGQRQLEQAGIESTYIPHAVDTNVFKPTFEIEGQPARKFMGIDDDAFLISMVSANKANGIQHRKGLSEALTAFSVFQRENPKAHLYLHMEPGNAFGGFVIPRILKSLAIPPDSVTIADPNMLRIGYPVETMAGIYTASDVLLMPSYGEGFGIPLIEAQACGTRVVTGSWTSMVDLAGPKSFLVSGQVLWDETQGAFYQMPLIASIVEALRLASKEKIEVDDESIQFAKEFDVEKVWQSKWLPFLKGVFDV